MVHCPHDAKPGQKIRFQLPIQLSEAQLQTYNIHYSGKVRSVMLCPHFAATGVSGFKVHLVLMSYDAAAYLTVNIAHIKVVVEYTVLFLVVVKPRLSVPLFGHDLIFNFADTYLYTTAD